MAPHEETKSYQKFSSVLTMEEKQTCEELKTLLSKGLAQNLMKKGNLLEGAKNPNDERDN